MKRVVMASGLAAAVATFACGCSGSSIKAVAAARPTPSFTTIVKSLGAATQTQTASVETSCFVVRAVNSTRTFPDSSAALAFASGHLLPRWHDAPQAFDRIGDRGATQFFMRSMTRADVVAVRADRGRWHIVGTGHC
jgi:hypothetical protein